MANITEADQAISVFMARTQRLITLTDTAGRQAARELLATLAAADRSVRQRLDTWVRLHGGGDVRFTQASLIAYQEQLQAVTQFVQASLLGLTAEEATRAMLASFGRNIQLIRDLEKAFTGLMVPLRLDEAIIMRMRLSLLARHATSVDRYGLAMIQNMQNIMAQGLIEGVSQHEMVNRLVTMGGPRGMVSLRAYEMQPGLVVRIAQEWIPEGLFVRYRSWAWRIVRSEVAEAQNATSQVTYEQATRELPDMQRKILAVLDLRTAQDSLGVHGQVRALNEPFVDGAGRVYMRPPSRPHDRETLIPWRPHWTDTPRSRPLSQRKQDEIWKRNQPWQAERARRRARFRRRNQRMAAQP